MSKLKGKQILPQFIDNVECPELYAEVKYFKIQHPTKVDKALIHSSLEGPENAVYYKTSIDVNTKKSGKIFIKLPDFWNGLVNKNTLHIQISPIGGFSQYYIDSIQGNYYISFDNNYAKLFNILIIAERIDIPSLIVEPDDYYNREEFFKD